jgi:hypothetical protein
MPAKTTFMKRLKCLLRGHVFVDSRTEKTVMVCARCRKRQGF